MKKGKGCLIGIIIVVILLIMVSCLGNSKKDNPSKNVATTSDNNSESKPAKNNTTKESKQTSVSKKSESKVPGDDSNVIKAGEYKIGEKVKAGEYKVFAENSVGGYVQDSKDSTGSMESIKYNDNFKNFTYIIVQDGEYLKLQNCYAIPVEKAKKFDGSEIADGMYKIGVDIPAGEYEFRASDGSAYIEVSTNPHDLESIVTNDNFDNNKIVSVSDGQYLKVQGATASK